MLGAFLAVATAAVLRGRVHQDEIFQFLEPANHIALGPWVRSWEWEQGLRNWAVPGLLGGDLKVLTILGVRHPWEHATAVGAHCPPAQALAPLALFSQITD